MTQLMLLTIAQPFGMRRVGVHGTPSISRIHARP